MKKKVTMDIGEKAGNKAVPATLKTIELIGFGFTSHNPPSATGTGTFRRSNPSAQDIYVDTKKGQNAFDLFYLMQSGKHIGKAVIRSEISKNETLTIEMEDVVVTDGFIYPKGDWNFTLNFTRATYSYPPGIVQVIEKYTIDPNETE